MKLISIIIPAYNCQYFIEETVDSVLNQSIGIENLEIIIINDGSKDDTLNILKEYEKQNQIILVDTPNRGVSAAREAGRNIAKGQYIQYLDSDDLLTSQKIEIQYKALEENKADIAYGDWQNFSEKEGRKTYLEKIERQIKGDEEIALFTDFWCPPAAILYSKSIVDKIGTWNMELPIIQDARYFLDAAIQKGKFIYTKGIMAEYRVSEGTSLSQRHGEVKFVNDVFTNAKQIHELWKDDLGSRKDKAEAIISCYRYCIQVFGVNNEEHLFEEAISKIYEIDAHFIPQKSKPMKYLSTVLGYAKAERLANSYRKIRKG
ncbi:glycosyl transferase [Bernardetia litoralis DSM 6794]|uniref:Glycosyl transferase n=1 Tax=Bernardetia litoralis (strain ATCC 23117 / DSM 6794 / NBRC 15988 / NCIMB 1366 / Fx l1 / Sio-4) TaxID=880071 RepID=I4AJZ8_BERLS|nr:glycosyltransferase [Bernardetia litoralis]AFM04283.1 glycosyl transferase [Bernardetia litoralis DSM 6794]